MLPSKLPSSTNDSSALPPLSACIPAVGESFELTDDKGVARVEVYARAVLPTQFGLFAIVTFRNNRDDKEHVALVRGSVCDKENVITRMHSECLTGDAFGSLRCDCRQQLERALDKAGQSESSVILYLRQEGRGIGLGNKIRAYALQEQGLDTVDANLHLGFDDDLRDYTVAALMLKALGVKSIDLVTNNPHKIAGLKRSGIDVQARVPALVPATTYNARYLATKAQRSGHLIPLPSSNE